MLVVNPLSGLTECVRVVRLQAASLVIGDQFQPLNGGMKRLKSGQRGGDSQHRPDEAALND